MTTLYLLEPPSGPAWAPFHGVRPIAELRAGAWRIRERWERTLGVSATAILSDHLADWSELDEPPVRPSGPVAGPAIVARADVAPASGGSPGSGWTRLLVDGTVAAWTVPAGATWTGDPPDGGADAELPGLRLAGTWDLLAALERLLEGDCAALPGRDPLPAGSIVLGDPDRVRIRGAVVEPGVVFDVRHGAVVLEADAEVRSGTRLEGPVWAGPGARLLGGFIRQCAIGPRCNVRGEVASSVFVGYANKSHDGFVGHSVLGHWVNLGALTTTSNLKNTYGPVRLEVDGARLETGRTFLGSLVGDHAKTAIGTMLGTGTVVSAGANVFGGAPPKWVPPFAWGAEGEERVTAEGFLRVAERVLPRRDVAWTEARARALRAVHARLCGR